MAAAIAAVTFAFTGEAPAEANLALQPRPLDRVQPPSVQIRPWHAQLGALIAARYAAAGDSSTAESWYRRVLAQSPLHPEATRGLALLLRAGGDDAEATRLCDELENRVGKEAACGPGAAPGKPD